MKWNPELYLKYKNERTQPYIDLVRRIPLEFPKRIIDIGCGPGNSTAVLAERYKNCYILGLDNSENMIETAKKQYPNLDFMLFDAGTDEYTIGKFDIVFSNACIQWISNHPKLLKNMMSLLNAGGVLAVQIPINLNEPIHQIINELSASPRWRDLIGNARIFNILPTEEYFSIIGSLSEDFEMWETIYYHRMKSHAEIMEWYMGTGLRPYLQKLNEDDRREFLKQVYQEVVKAYPLQTNGEIIFKFPRFFFIANKS